MPTWAGLFRRIDDLDPLDRRAHSERTRFQEWAVSAERRVMADFARVARAKSRETQARTGVCVAVALEEHAPSLSSFAGTRHVVSLAFAGSSVGLYATRPAGEAPSVHMACQRAATTSRYPVLVTLPGCLVIRSGDFGYQPISLPERVPTSVDAVVLRAFVLLFGAFESMTATHSVAV